MAFTVSFRPEAPAPAVVASAGPAERPRFPFLDGVRGVLALAVVFSHGTNLTTGFNPSAPLWMRVLQCLGALCVPGFIFLSGFCLGLPTVRRGFRLDSTRQFWERRANRILPAYYAALAFAFIVAVFVTHLLRIQDFWGAKPQPDVIGPLLLIHDFYGSTPYDGPLWSLAPEVHVYFCFPLVLWLFRRLPPPGATLLWVIASSVAQHFAALHGLRSLSLYLYGIFAVGVYAAWHLGAGRALPSERVLKRTAVCAALLLAASASALGYARFWGMLPAISVAECLILLPVFGLLFRQPDCGLGRFLGSRPALFAGRVSYSLYLTHWVVLSLVLLLVPNTTPAGPRCAALLTLGVPASLAVATMFYGLFEAPYLSRRLPPK